MDDFKWQPFVLFVANDFRLETELAPAFENSRQYFSTRNTGVAMKIFDRHRVDVLVIDESLFQDKTIDRKYRQYIFDLYKKAIEKNPKIMTLILFDKKNSAFVEGFKRRSEVFIKLDRKTINVNRMKYLLQVFARQTYRSVVVNDIPINSVVSIPLYTQKDAHSEVELFLKEGESFTKEKREILHQIGLNRIFVKSEQLSEMLHTTEMFFSEESHLIRKRYKMFLSYFLDCTHDDKTYIGKQLSEIGMDIILRLEKLIAKFPTPYDAFCELPFRRFSELSHGLNSAIYTLILGRHCCIDNLEELAFAALVHDHGKFEINFTPGTHGRFFSSLMENLDYKKHPEYCLELIKRKCIKLNRESMNAILCHHENFDATGFPQGIGGRELSLESSLMSLVDLYDHLKTIHKYNTHVTAEQAWYALLDVHKKSLLGAKFNPELIAMIDEFFTQKSMKKSA